MPRQGLSTGSVIDAAVALVDEGGADGLTLAGLAARLGIKPPSLYKHVTSLDALRDAVAGRALGEANRRLLKAVAGLSGDAALFALGHAYWDFARDHPGLYAASRRAVPPGGSGQEAAAELLDTVLAVLRGYRVAGDDALHAARGLRAIVEGFLSLDAAGGFGLPLDLEESFRRLLQDFAAGLKARAGEAAEGAPARG